MMFLSERDHKCWDILTFLEITKCLNVAVLTFFVVYLFSSRTSDFISHNILHLFRNSDFISHNSVSRNSEFVSQFLFLRFELFLQF